MQDESQKNELLEFKNEILGEIRLIEKKFVSEFNTKFTEINSTFKEMDLRLDTISQNNNSLLDLISKKNMNFDKLEELDIFKNKTEETLITQKIEFENIFQEIEQLNKKYEKIVKENLIVTGYIGLGYKYKNLGEYLIYNMNEIDKLRYDTQQNKIKVVNWEKTAKEIISSSLLRFETYTDNKYKRINAIFEQKLNKLNKKMIDLEAEINKYQYEIDILVKSMKNDKQKLSKVKDTNIDNIEKKLEEFNKKLSFLIPDNQSPNKSKFQSPQRKRNKNNKDSLIYSNERIYQICKSKRNIHRTNKKIDNLYDQNVEKKEKKNLYFKKERKDSSIFLDNNNNDNSHIFTELEPPKRKNSFINENNINIKSPQKSIIKKNNFNGRNNFNEQKLIVKTNFEYFKLIENRKDSHINKTNYLTNLKICENQEEKNKENRNESIIIINSPQKTPKKDIIKTVSDNNMITKEENNNINIKNIINTKTLKLKINSRNKINTENPLTSIAREEYELTIKKNEFKDKLSNFKKNSFQDNISRAESNQKDIIFISSYGNNKKDNSEYKKTKTKEKINIENNNKDIINIKSLISPIKNLSKSQRKISSLNNIKLKNDLQLSVNSEHKKPMPKISIYYNNKREQVEPKINQKILVDCNLINLKFKNTSKKNLFYSTNRSKANKIANFGKTNSKFFSKRERYTYTRSVNSSDNKNNL